MICRRVILGTLLETVLQLGQLPQLGRHLRREGRLKCVEDLPEKAKAKVVSKLEKLTEPFPMLHPSWVPHHLAGRWEPDSAFGRTARVTGKIEDVHYVRNFLEPLGPYFCAFSFGVVVLIYYIHKLNKQTMRPKQVEEFVRIIDKTCSSARKSSVEMARH